MGIKNTIKHLNDNQGAYSLILTIVIIIIALAAYINSTSPPKPLPNIKAYDVSYSKYGSKMITPFDAIVVIYNSGTAPCFDLTIEDNMFLSDVAIIKTPEKLIDIKESVYNTTYSYLAGECYNLLEEDRPRICHFKLGYILPQEILLVGLNINKENFFWGEDRYKHLKKKVDFDFVCEGSKDKLTMEFNSMNLK